MQSQFLNSFFNQLFQYQINKNENLPALQWYPTMLRNIMKQIQKVCNNSRVTLSSLYEYLASNIMTFPLQQQSSSNPTHCFLRNLNVQQNYVVYFVQIIIRLVMLGILCKFGQQGNKKQWRFSLNQLFKEVKLQFIFKYSEPLVNVFEKFFNIIEPCLSQIAFYQKIVEIFEQNDLDYVSTQIQAKINKIKQKWRKSFLSKKEQFTPKTQNKPNITDIKQTQRSQKMKNLRKSVKIIQNTQRSDQDEHLKRRISDFRQSQKIRMSQLHQSANKRTLFQSRKYKIKTNSQDQTYQQQQILFIQQNQQQNTATITNKNLKTEIVKEQIQVCSPQNVSKTQTLIKFTSKSTKKRLNQASIVQKDDEIEVIAKGTPPKTKKQFPSQKNVIIINK